MDARGPPTDMRRLVCCSRVGMRRRLPPQIWKFFFFCVTSVGGLTDTNCFDFFVVPTNRNIILLPNNLYVLFYQLKTFRYLLYYFLRKQVRFSSSLLFLFLFCSMYHVSKVPFDAACNYFPRCAHAINLYWR
jgi:hypothetical protein